MKTCTKCGKVKSLDSYYKKPGGKGGIASWCKSCHREYDRRRVWQKIWGKDIPYQDPPVVETEPELEIVNIPIPDEYSINSLVCAVIIKAARDARNGDFEARTWLQTEGVAWGEAIGIELHKTIPEWIANGCLIEPHGEHAHDTQT